MDNSVFYTGKWTEVQVINDVEPGILRAHDPVWVWCRAYEGNGAFTIQWRDLDRSVWFEDEQDAIMFRLCGF